MIDVLELDLVRELRHLQLDDIIRAHNIWHKARRRSTGRDRTEGEGLTLSPGMGLSMPFSAPQVMASRSNGASPSCSKGGMVGPRAPTKVFTRVLLPFGRPSYLCLP